MNFETYKPGDGREYHFFYAVVTTEVITTGVLLGERDSKIGSGFVTGNEAMVDIMENFHCSPDQANMILFWCKEKINDYKAKSRASTIDRK